MKKSDDGFISILTQSNSKAVNSSGAIIEDMPYLSRYDFYTTSFIKLTS